MDHSPRDAIYPFTNRGWVVIAALALVTLVPYGGWFSWTVSILYALWIIQSTMRGEPEMPGLPPLSKLRESLTLWWEGLAASVLIMWPMTLMFLVLAYKRLAPDDKMLDWTAGVLPFFAFIFLAFWPASMGLVAAGYGIIGAITPSLIRGVFGPAYAPALVAVLIGGFFLLILNAVLNSIPHVGGVLGRVVVLWFEFFLARFVGHAMRAHEARKK